MDGSLLKSYTVLISISKARVFAATCVSAWQDPEHVRGYSTNAESLAREHTTADAQFVLGRASAVISIDGERSIIHEYTETTAEALPVANNVPTEEEKETLRKVPGALPLMAYYICAVEFAERASYYGVNGLFGNFVNRPLPANGNGYGAPPRGTQTSAGALGLGSVISTAVSQSFSMLTYALPVFFGWLADARTGRFKLICAGVAVCGISHVIMVASGSKHLLATGQSKAPFFLSVYILAIGAGKIMSFRFFDRNPILML